MTPQISTDPRPGAPAAPSGGDPAKLGFGWRLLMAAVGTAMVAAGALAVFRTKQQAGSTVLITIGAAILVVAGCGFVITRLKFGENEIEFAPARQVLLTDLENGPPAEALARLDTAATYDPGVLTLPQIQEAAKRAYGSLVAQAVREAAGDGVRVDPTNDFPFNFVLSKDDRHIAVKVWQLDGGEGSRNAVVKGMAYLVDDLPRRNYEGLLIVTNAPVSGIVTPRVGEESRGQGQKLEAVVWANGLNTPELRDAIGRLLAEG
jgi:hypothetical protein